MGFKKLVILRGGEVAFDKLQPSLYSSSTGRRVLGLGCWKGVSSKETLTDVSGAVETGDVVEKERSLGLTKESKELHGSSQTCLQDSANIRSTQWFEM